MWLLLLMLCPISGLFIFRALGVLCLVVASALFQFCVQGAYCLVKILGCCTWVKEPYAFCSIVHFFCDFLFLMWLLLLMLCPISGLFIFRALGVLCLVVASAPVLCARCILPCENSRLLHLGKRAFRVYGRVVS